MSDSSGLTCNHRLTRGQEGLCLVCRRLYAADPQAFREYGPHVAGEENWRKLLDEIAADNDSEKAVGNERPSPDVFDEIPF